MNRRNDLTLYEEILLLALDDKKGTTDLGGMYTRAMGGAVLAELVMRQAIAVGDDKQKKVNLVSGQPLGDSILDECLQQIAEQKKDKSARAWVMKFSNLKDFKNRTARQLVTKGILKESEDKVLGLFKRTIFPESDHGPERELVERLRKAIFTYSSEVEARTVVIVALAQATGLLNKIFDKKKLKERKKRLEKLTSGSVAGQATKEAVEAVQAAILVSTVVVPVVITST